MRVYVLIMFGERFIYSVAIGCETWADERTRVIFLYRFRVLLTKVYLVYCCKVGFRSYFLYLFCRFERLLSVALLTKNSNDYNSGSLVTRDCVHLVTGR